MGDLKDCNLSLFFFWGGVALGKLQLLGGKIVEHASLVRLSQSHVSPKRGTKTRFAGVETWKLCGSEFHGPKGAEE